MISWQDVVNGAFECLAGFMVLLSCRRVYKDKAVAGVSIWATAFFTLWGYWNIYYYPHLDQWLSFFGGLFIVAANTIWVALLIKYRNGPAGGMVSHE